MKTFQQFQIDTHQLDEGKLALGKIAFKGLSKLTNSMRAGPAIKHLRTPFNKPVRMYHGTLKTASNKIMNKGFTPTQTVNPKTLSTELSNVYLTTNPKRAEYYANLMAKTKKGKPDIVAVNVNKTKNMRKGVRGDEFVVPVKDTIPTAQGVKPIKRRKGEVIQDNYQHVKEAKVDLLRAIARVPRGKFTPLNIAQAKGTVRNIRGGFYSPSSNTLAKGIADANKRLKVQSALGNLVDPKKNPLAATTDPQTLYRRVIGSSSKKLSKDSRAIFRDLEKSSKNKNLFGPEISQKDIQFAKNVRSVNKKTSQPTAIQQGAGLTDLASISRRMKSSNPETADYARKQFTDRKLEVAKRRLIRKGRRTYKPVDDTDKA